MSERLRATKAKAEMHTQDVKDFLTILPILGIRGVIASLRTPIELIAGPEAYTVGPTVLQQPDRESTIAYSEAA